MPIDKFGRHLYSHDDPQTFLVEVEDISKLMCESTLSIAAIYTDSQGFFILQGSAIVDGNRIYSFPMNATIKHAKLDPEDATIYINSRLYKLNELLGLRIKRGDQLAIKWNKTAATRPMVCELIVQTPIVSQSS